MKHQSRNIKSGLEVASKPHLTPAAGLRYPASAGFASNFIN